MNIYNLLWFDIKPYLNRNCLAFLTILESGQTAHPWQFVQSNQALYCWMAKFKSTNLTMDNSKNGKWTSSFDKFNRLMLNFIRIYHIFYTLISHTDTLIYLIDWYIGTHIYLVHLYISYIWYSYILGTHIYLIYQHIW